MKKLAILFLALIIAAPALSYAGSATSRWDMTIGGYVRMDVIWSGQDGGGDQLIAIRDTKGGQRANVSERYSSLQWATGGTDLNFAIKGPDAWGAKTSAFVEGEFRSVTASPYGGFALKQGFLKMDWANTSLLMGHAWQAWGAAPIGPMIVGQLHAFFNKPNRLPQVRVTQMFGKNFSVAAAASAATSGSTATQSINWSQTATRDSNRSNVPDLSLDFGYKSDACGKIGFQTLEAHIGGFWGQDKVTGIATSKNLDKWGAATWVYVPIIPEKQTNKAGALAFLGEAYMGQNAATYFAYAGPLPGSAPTSYYNRPGDGTGATFGNGVGNNAIDPKAPIVTAAWGMLTYYITHELFVNGFYGYHTNHTSKQYQLVNPDSLRSVSQYIFNVNYDVNPAIRFSAEYLRSMATYGAYASQTAANDSKGSYDSVRFAAFYFF